MAPSIPVVIAEWAKTHIDTQLQRAEEGGGECRPAGALAAAYDLHKLAVTKVPAYADFVAGQQAHTQGHVQPRADGQSTPQHEPSAPASLAAPAPSWEAVPHTSKDTYCQRYPLPRRCMGGGLAGVADFVHASSGSSGAPTLWPRSTFDELAVCARFEQVLWDNFEAHKRTTLAVVAFPLGSWVGGLFTTLCLRFLSVKGYRLTMVTPGNRVPDILQLVRELGPHHQQTLLLGYPPFLKGVADAGVAQGLPWAEFNMKLVLAGEVFSEEWRTLMAHRLGMRNVLRDVVSLYGTADAGVIGNETAISVAVRRWLAQHPDAAAELFGAHRLPTLIQYDPFNRLLEVHPEDGTLVVSAVGTPNTASPLLRYCIQDAGGLISHADLLAFVRRRGFEMPPDLGATRTLPFAWVFGRSFWTVSVFGANVYVENIMSGMEQAELAQSTTGKFVLYVEEGADLDARLAVRVELAPGVPPSEELQQQLAAVLLRELRRLNSEYANYVPEESQLPRVHLHAHGDPQFFPTGVKHKWVLDASS